jgi:hypothetical protein
MSALRAAPLARRSTQLTLPVAAPAPVLEPQPGGLVARACAVCEVTWYGADGDDCWCCHEPGIDGPLRLFVIARS